MSIAPQIPSGSNPAGKPEAVFLAVSCVHPVWSGYAGIPESSKQELVPLCMLAMRWDGTIGFIGGAVDPGETLLDAVAREALEEAGISAPDNLAKEWTLVSSHDMGQLCVHLFSWSVDFDVFSAILSGQHLAQHHMSEGTIFAAHCRNYGRGKRSFEQLCRQNFAPGALPQLAALIDHLGWSHAFGSDSPAMPTHSRDQYPELGNQAA